jgi:hypothetical protein
MNPWGSLPPACFGLPLGFPEQTQRLELFRNWSMRTVDRSAMILTCNTIPSMRHSVIGVQRGDRQEARETYL